MQKIAPTKGKAKYKNEKERDDFKECATAAENTGIHLRSAPRQGAKEKVKAKENPKGKEEYGRWMERRKTGTWGNQKGKKKDQSRR